MQDNDVVILALLLVLSVASLKVWFAIGRDLLGRREIVPYEARLHVRWNMLDVLGLFLLWPMLEVMSLRFTASAATLSSGEFTSPALAAVTAAHLIWIALAVLYLQARTKLSPGEFGFDTSRLGWDVRLGCVAFLAAVPVVYSIQLLIVKWFPTSAHPLVVLIQKQPSAGLLALATLGAAAVSPVAEEFLFRVVLQGWLQRHARRLARRAPGNLAKAWRAMPIVVSSALFAAVHQGYDRVALFVLALFLGYLFQRTGRIFPSLVLHVCVNTLAVAGLWLGAM